MDVFCSVSRSPGVETYTVQDMVSMPLPAFLAFGRGQASQILVSSANICTWQLFPIQVWSLHLASDGSHACACPPVPVLGAAV